MKKMYLMKGMAVMALGLIVASCNKMDFDQDAYQKAKEAESRQKFINNVMGGQDIDPNQTWSTTTACNVSVTPNQDGILKIFTANPIGNKTASLYTMNVKGGQTETFTVARPSDKTTLYATVMDENDMILDMLAFDATAEEVAVDLNMPSETSTRAATLRRAPTQPTQPTFSGKPTMPTTYKNTLAEAQAAGAQPINAGIQAGGVYYMTPDMTAPDIQNTSLTIYFDGDFTSTPFNGSNYQNGNGTTYCVTAGSKLKLGTVRERLTIYLAPGATLDISECLDWQGKSYTDWTGKKATTFTFTKENAGLYMNSDSKVIGGDLYFKDGYTVLNEGGIIETENLHVENGAILYNDKEIKATGAISLNNTNGELINNGKMMGASLSLRAGTKFYNTLDGDVTISGATDIYNESDSWMNDGLYKSGSFKCWDTQKVYNNCRLTVTGEFTMGGSDSNFVLNGDASLICNSFNWNSDNYFFLGGNSIVSVANELKSNNSNWGYGFYQSGNDYAVISAKSITTDDPNNQWRVWYSGKIYVDTDSHFAFVSWNQTQKNIYKTDDVKFSKEQSAAPVSWPESKCKPAYNYKKPDPDPVMYYYYAFEDLGAIGDFDFNDVVLRVSAPNNGESTVYLMAAGGTLKSKVVYGDQTLCNEVHEAFEVELGGGNFDMVNTGYTERKFVSLGTVTIAEGADMANLPFGIVVTGNNGESVKVTREVDHKGTAPLMIVVNGYPEGDNAGKWFWAKERVNISVAYPDFGAWGANVEENQDWYLNYVDDSVWKY